MQKALLTLVTIMLCRTISADDNALLYKAFLCSDMSVWHDFIETNENCNDPNRLILLLDIEYNYLAWASQQNITDNQDILDIFNRHIKQYSTSKHNKSYLNTLYSAYYLYNMFINRQNYIKNAMKSIDYATKSLENPHPLALMHCGFMYFYRPTWAGGSKTKALSYLQQAEYIFQKNGDFTANWDYLNLQMHIAQCLWKLGKKEEALAKCNSILEQEPDFNYVREELIREVRSEK